MTDVGQEIQTWEQAAFVVDERTETPELARARVATVGAWLARAERDLKDARDQEVEAKHTYTSSRRRFQLSGDRPKVERGGFTVAEQAAWVDQAVEDLELAWEIAGAARKAAQDRYDTINAQAMMAQALLRSIDRAMSQGGY